MPIHYEIRDRTIWFRTTDDVDYEAGLGVLESGIDEAHRKQPGLRWDVVFDIRESREDRSSDELRGIARLLSGHSSTLSGRCAVVAADDLRYGLGRMFSAYSADHQIEVQVVRNVDEALAWLGGPERTP